MATAMHLSTSSKITVVSNLNKVYSSEGVPTLNMVSKVEYPKSLWSTLQSYKVQEAKMANQERLKTVNFQCIGAVALPLNCHNFGMHCLICDSYDT